MSMHLNLLPGFDVPLARPTASVNSPSPLSSHFPLHLCMTIWWRPSECESVCRKIRVITNLEWHIFTVSVTIPVVTVTAVVEAKFCHFFLILLPPHTFIWAIPFSCLLYPRHLGWLKCTDIPAASTITGKISTSNCAGPHWQQFSPLVGTMSSAVICRWSKLGREILNEKES